MLEGWRLWGQSSAAGGKPDDLQGPKYLKIAFKVGKFQLMLNIDQILMFKIKFLVENTVNIANNMNPNW